MRIAILLLLATCTALAQSPKLEYVVILGRHGVRSPTAPAAEYGQYSADPWPEWSVAPGELTAHGARLMTILGSWYRGWLAQDGLLSATGCGQAGAVHVRADVGQRTRESGRAFAQGLMPGCVPEVHLATGETDPLFHPVPGTGSTLTENLLLEYAEGMTGKDLGWGRFDAAKLTEILAVHIAYADLARRTPYLARVQGSNLLQHILLSMDQAIAAKPVAGALGKPGDRVLVLAGHDTNIAHVAGMLNLSWLIPGYPRDDTPPAGALVIRLWRAASGSRLVEVLYVAQTLDQLREATALNATAPPGIAPVFVPGCQPSGTRIDCDWTIFRDIAESAIDRKAVAP